jgi:hypothetical protein
MALLPPAEPADRHLEHPPLRAGAEGVGLQDRRQLRLGRHLLQGAGQSEKEARISDHYPLRAEFLLDA